MLCWPSLCTPYLSQVWMKHSYSSSHLHIKQSSTAKILLLFHSLVSSTIHVPVVFPSHLLRTTIILLSAQKVSFWILKYKIKPRLHWIYRRGKENSDWGDSLFFPKSKHFPSHDRWKLSAHHYKIERVNIAYSKVMLYMSMQKLTLFNQCKSSIRMWRCVAFDLSSILFVLKRLEMWLVIVQIHIYQVPDTKVEHLVKHIY